MGLRGDFSCIYAIFAYPHLYIASLIAFLSRKPLYYTMVAAEYELVGRGSILQKLTKKLARRANKVIVTGDRAIQILRGYGIPDEKIVEYRITDLVDLSAFFPLGKDRPTDLIVVSRLARDKHINVFVDIVDSIKKTRPNVSADIVGDGAMMEELVDYVRAKGLSENIVFHGWLSSPEAVNEILNSAKIFVMNSSHEGGPFTVPEAMAAGLCVVSSDVGEVKKIIHHGEDGFIIDRFDDLEEYVDIIKELLEDPAQLQKIQQRAARIKEREGNRHLSEFWKKVAASL
jgi:glycosyltransferase involved in cell wall biosynthesis